MGFHHRTEDVVHVFYAQVAGIVEEAQNLFLVAESVEFFFRDMTIVDGIKDGDVVTTVLAVEEHVFQILHCGIGDAGDGIVVEVGNNLATFTLHEVGGDVLFFLGIVETVEVEGEHSGVDFNLGDTIEFEVAPARDLLDDEFGNVFIN